MSKKAPGSAIPDKPSAPQAPGPVDPGTAPSGPVTSNGQLVVDPVEMARQAAALDDAAYKVGFRRTNASGAMAALGAFWGSDTTGSAFESNYLETRDSVFDGLDNAEAILRSMSRALTDAAAGYSATESDLESDIKGLHSVVDNGPQGPPMPSSSKHTLTVTAPTLTFKPTSESRDQ